MWNGKSALKISSTFLPATFTPCLYILEFFTVQEQRGEQVKCMQEHWNKTSFICGLELHGVFISTEGTNAQCHPHIKSKELTSQFTLLRSLISVFIIKPCSLWGLKNSFELWNNIKKSRHSLITLLEEVFCLGSMLLYSLATMVWENWPRLFHLWMVWFQLNQAPGLYFLVPFTCLLYSYFFPLLPVYESMLSPGQLRP